MTIEQITEFFRLMLILNIGMLFISTLATWLLKGMAMSIHSKMFGVTESQINISIYAFLGAYKLFIIVFNAVPYVALLILGG